MKNFFIGVFLIFSLLFFVVNEKVYAQNPTPASLIPQIPGIDCGSSIGSTSAEKKCCSTQLTAVNGLLGQINNLRNTPVIGGVIGFLTGPLDWIESSSLQLQRKTNTVSCAIGYPSNINDPNCTCLDVSNITPTPIETLRKMCSDYFSGSKDFGNCMNCANSAGVWTSLGVCAYGDFGRFIQETVFKWGIGLAGIFAFLCIIYASFLLQTSRGNPEKIKKAQELLTSCIMGLMLIIFSVFILKLIGVDILQLPNFGK